MLGLISVSCSADLLDCGYAAAVGPSAALSHMCFHASFKHIASKAWARILRCFSRATQGRSFHCMMMVEKGKTQHGEHKKQRKIRTCTTFSRKLKCMNGPLSNSGRKYFCTSVISQSSCHRFLFRRPLWHLPAINSFFLLTSLIISCVPATVTHWFWAGLLN